MRRVVVCPYCSHSSPHPDQIGLTYQCACGAVFALFPEYELDVGLVRLVSGLFQEKSTPLTDLLKNCQVTVFRNCEVGSGPVPVSRLSEFVREISFQGSQEPAVDLIWVVRSDSTPPASPPFGQSQD